MAVSRETMCWAGLAAAIVREGQKENDQRFLQSDWCATLKSFVADVIQDSNKSNDKTQTQPGASGVTSRNGTVYSVLDFASK